MIWSILSAIGLREAVVQFMLVNALLALSIYLTLHTGMFSLANAGFMSIGAYVSVIATQHWGLPLGVALVLGMLAAEPSRSRWGRPVLRLNDIYLAIATIGFAEIVRIFCLNLIGLAGTLSGQDMTLTGGALGIKGIPNTQTWHLLWRWSSRAISWPAGRLAPRAAPCPLSARTRSARPAWASIPFT